MKSCPKCGFEGDKNDLECRECGVILDKFDNHVEKKVHHEEQKTHNRGKVLVGFITGCLTVIPKDNRVMFWFAILTCGGFASLWAFATGPLFGVLFLSGLSGLILMLLTIASKQNLKKEKRTLEERRRLEENHKRWEEETKRQNSLRFKAKAKLDFPVESKEFRILFEMFGSSYQDNLDAIEFHSYPSFSEFRAHTIYRPWRSLSSPDDPIAFKNIVADLLKSFSSIINEHDPEEDLSLLKIQQRIDKGEPTKRLFPMIITFYNTARFLTPFGEESYNIDKEVSISLDYLRKIRSSFNGDLLHKVARVHIIGPSGSPIDSSSMTFIEKITPQLVKGGRTRRNMIDDELREHLLAEADYACQYCGARLSDGATLEIDHIIAVSRGGTDDYGNLQVLCASCNRKKGAA